MLTIIQIQFLNEVWACRWTEENNVINIEGDVSIYNKNLSEIPVQFGRVNGNFNCQMNHISSLYGSPKEISGGYSCSTNKLKNLIGAPDVCNDYFYCHTNKLTSLEGGPKVIKGNLCCHNNPDLEYLWGIGRVEGKVAYDNENEINQWIIECSKKDIIFPHFILEENINWIKMTGQYSCLLVAPHEIRQHFSSKILHLVDSGIC